MKLKREDIASFYVRSQGRDVQFTSKKGDTYRLQMGISMNNGVESLTIMMQKFQINRLHGGVCDLWSAIKPYLTNFEKSKTKANKEAILLKLIEIWNELIPKWTAAQFTVESERLTKKRKSTPEQKGFWPKQIKEIQIGSKIIKTKDLNKLL